MRTTSALSGARRLLALVAAVVITLVLGAPEASANTREDPSSKRNRAAVEAWAAQPVQPLRDGTMAALRGVELKPATKVETFTSTDAMYFVLEDGDPSAIVIETPRALPRVNPDGSVTLVRGAETAGIAAPWAKDAAGHTVPTRFEVQGDRLVQVVEVTPETHFPVVADPKLTYGWGVYLNMTGYEIKSIGSAFFVGGGTVGILACNAKSLPSPLSFFVTTLCVVVGGPTVLSIVQSVATLWRSNTLVSGACYQKKILPSMGGWTRVSIGNCV